MYEHICGPGCGHETSPDADREVREEFKVARRSFLRDAMVAGGSAAGALGVSLSPSAIAQSAKPGNGMASHYGTL